MSGAAWCVRSFPDPRRVSVSLARPDSYQQFADANQIAVLGVSGTRPKGKRSFVWSEDAGQDLARLDTALKEVSDLLTVQPGQAVVFGLLLLS